MRLEHLRTALAAVALAGALPGCGSSPSGHAGSAPARSSFDGAALPAGTRAPAFTLTDQDGRAVSLASYRGKVVVLSFMYSTCGAPCVLIAQQIRGALDELASRPHGPVVLLVSSDPAADTPSSVRRFLSAVSLTGRARYLYGPPGAIRAAWRAYPALAHDAGKRAAGQFAGVMLIDEHGDERVLFGVEQLTPEVLAHDISRLSP